MRIEKIEYEGQIKEWVIKNFETYNASKGFDLPKTDFCYALKDDKGTLVGVAKGSLQAAWLHLNDLVVSDDLRGQGHGTQLLKFIEDLAKQHNCHGITLNTLGFQAPDFYLQHGYEEYAKLDNFGGTQKHFFKKELKKD